MNNVLGFVVLAAVAVVMIWLHVRSQPGNVATRRHARYQRRFAEAKTPAEQLRHAHAYLGEVTAAANDQTVTAIAKEVFALAVKRNGAGSAPAGPPQVVSQKPA